MKAAVLGLAVIAMAGCAKDRRGSPPRAGAVNVIEHCEFDSTGMETIEISFAHAPLPSATAVVTDPAAPGGAPIVHSSATTTITLSLPVPSAGARVLTIYEGSSLIDLVARVLGALGPPRPCNAPIGLSVWAKPQPCMPDGMPCIPEAGGGCSPCPPPCADPPCPVPLVLPQSPPTPGP